jgi:hypothetical protein
MGLLYKGVLIIIQILYFLLKTYATQRSVHIIFYTTFWPSFLQLSLTDYPTFGADMRKSIGQSTIRSRSCGCRSHTNLLASFSCSWSKFLFLILWHFLTSRCLLMLPQQKFLIKSLGGLKIDCFKMHS